MKLFDAEAMGRRITRRRQELGLTQKELAESIGLSISFYGHIERGARVPSVPTLALIANPAVRWRGFAAAGQPGCTLPSKADFYG